MVGDLESLVSSHPLRERLWGQLMLALYRSGRQADALRAYQRVRQLLGEELGIEPSDELQRLEEEILLQAPQLVPRPPKLHNLPAATTSFIGREKQVAEAVRLLESSRLLTLAGPGGIGKTRLALQVAREVVGAFPHGVFFVSLAPISDPDLVPAAITSALGLTQAPGPPLAHLCQYLAERELLLVLDNFGHVAEASLAVAKLLAAAPGLKVLVTSRAPLRLSGERELEVPSLELPDLRATPSPEVLAATEAVKLFVERAEAARPDFRLTPENAAVVAEITRRLDGLPLAIELAAARVKLLTPQAIADHLGDRLRFLVGGPRDAPRRQQTLRDAIAWSYDLLDLPTRRLLARLAVFRGGAALEQVAAVCLPADQPGVDLLEGLGELVNQSLLRREPSEDTPRLAMLETIRQFAWDRLVESGEAPEIERSHAHTYLQLAEEAAGHVLTWDQGVWLDRLERDHDNLRVAISWALLHEETELALRLTSALWRFWQIRGYLEEAANRLDQALELPGGNPRTRALALEAAGGVAYWRGEMRKAADRYRQSLHLMEELDDRAGVANALYNLSFPYFFGDEPDFELARELLMQSLAISRELSDEAGLAKGLYGLGSVAWKTQDWNQARERFNQALEIVRKRDDPFHLGWILFMLGSTEVRDGHPELARPLLKEGLRTFAKLGDVTGILFHLHYFTALAIANDQPERADRLVSAAARLLETSGARLMERLSHDLPEFQDPWRRLRTHSADRLPEGGQQMAVEEIVGLAADEPDLATGTSRLGAASP